MIPATESQNDPLAPQTDPQAEGAAAETAAAPAVPIDLEQDPFGGYLDEEGGDDVAGLGSIIRSFLKGGKKAKPKGRPAQGAPQEPDDAAPPPEPGREMTPAEPAVEGRLQGPEVQLGTTRPLANLNYFDAPETQGVLSKIQAFGKTPDAQSWASTEARALATDVTKLTGREPSLNWAPGDVLKMRQLLDAQGKSLHEMATSLNGKLSEGLDVSAEEMAEFELRSVQLVGTQNAVAGLATEAGRLLNSLQIRVDTPEAAWRAMADVVSRGGGDDSIKAKIRNVAIASNPGQVQRAVQEGLMEKSWKALLLLRYNMMLSSVRTHAANIAGSSMVTAYESAVIDPLSQINNLLLVGGSKLGKLAGLPVQVEQMLPPSTSVSSWRAAVGGMKDGLVLASQIARGTADPAQYGGKFANEIGVRYKPGEGWGQASGSAAVRGAGMVMSTPTRLLEAEDAFFRSTNYAKRLDQLALDKAHAMAGGDNALRQTFYDELMANPPAELMRAAKEYGQKMTFTNDPSIYGKLLSAAAKTGEALTYAPPMKLIIPFVHTPANLLGYTLEQGLGGTIAPRRFIQQLSGTARERADAISRFEMSVGLGMLLYSYWEDGSITGMGSTNWNTTKVMQSLGWQSNSFRDSEGKYFALNRMDPMGSTLGMYATAFELFNEQGDKDKMSVMVGTLLNTADMMMDRAFLSGIADLVVALGQKKAGIQHMGNLVASTTQSMFMPNVVRDARYYTDPNRREMKVDYEEEGFIGGVWSRFQKSLMNTLPVASKRLPPAVDWKGDYITNDAPAWARAFVPITVTKESFDLASTEILRNNVGPSKPDHRISIPRTGGSMKVNLLSLDPSGVLYAAYQQRVGKHRHTLVTKMANSREYAKALDEGKGGYAESPIGRKMSQVLSKGQQIANAEFLQALAEPGARFCIEEQCYTVSPDQADAFQLGEAAKSYLRYREKLESVPGLTYQEKAQPALPPSLRPRTDLRF